MADSSNTSTIWKPVVGFPGYEVNRAGQIKSTERFTRRRDYLVHVKERVLTPTIKTWKTGRPVAAIVSLWRSGKKSDCRVHRIVLEAFIGPCPKEMEGCHNNGDPTDNRLENLRWDSHANNRADMVRHGTITLPPRYLGERHPNAKMTAEIVRAIRRSSGTANDVARKLGVTCKMVYDVRRGVTWTHVS